MRHDANHSFDVAVVGGGILGLAGAWAAARRGLKVALFEKDATAAGASVRNFGFITITGQDVVDVRPRALRSRGLWLELCEHTGIRIVQRHMLMLAQRPQAAAVLHEFVKTERGQHCRLLPKAEIRKLLPQSPLNHIQDVLYSPHELRVESFDALPRFTAWLRDRLNVSMFMGCEVHSIARPHLVTTYGTFSARHILVCPGADSKGPLGATIASSGITRCKLQMLRLASPRARFPATIMSDFSLIRYEDFAQQPAAAALKSELAAQYPLMIEHGIHLIVAQNDDLSLTVGDSHHYADQPDPFSDPAIEQLILEEYERALGMAPPSVLARWIGTYASRSGPPIVIEKPQDGVRVMTVTSGCGASIGLALGEEVLEQLLADQ